MSTKIFTQEIYETPSESYEVVHTLGAITVQNGEVVLLSPEASATGGLDATNVEL